MTGAELLAWLQALPAEDLNLPVMTPELVGEEAFAVEFHTGVKVETCVIEPGWLNTPKGKYIVIEKES